MRHGNKEGSHDYDDDDDDDGDELTNHPSGAHGDIGLAHQGTLEHLNTFEQIWRKKLI